VYPLPIDGDTYLAKDLTQKAYSAKHFKMVVACVVGIVVYVIGIPAYCVYSIRKHHQMEKLQDPGFRKRLGMLYDGYTEQWCWWEGRRAFCRYRWHCRCR
jgi:hypothetical protein